LSVKSAISGAARAVGVFAPGHLGELSRVIPHELVDAVLAECGCRDRRLRVLPVRVGVYFVLALCLFPEVGYLQVWMKMAGGVAGAAAPTAKALRDVRRRVGAAPLKALFEVLAGPVAWPRTPGVSYRGYRTVSFDGCSSQKAADSARNRAWLGEHATAGYPMLMLMTLVETGTRALIGAVFGSRETGETAYAARLLHLLRPDMLVLWDRGFDGNRFLAEVDATGAKVLGRMRSHRRPAILTRIGDGSYLSRLGRVPVRVIDARVALSLADGSSLTGHYLLVTTLTDHRAHPAADLITLYHERWEHESAYYALCHTLIADHVLRSGDPAGLEQELWALLCVYQALRTVMADAAQSTGGIDPDRVCFTTTYQAARDQLIRAAIDGDTITAKILGTLLPARRARLSSRKVKSSNCPYQAIPRDGRPAAGVAVTALTIRIQPPPPAPAHYGEPHTPGTGLINRVLDLMRTHPDRHWHAQQIAELIGHPNLTSLRVQLSKHAQNATLRKTAPATYTLNPT
jgi:hypothetical protein